MPVLATGVQVVQVGCANQALLIPVIRTLLSMNTLFHSDIPSALHPHGRSSIRMWKINPWDA